MSAHAELIARLEAASGPDRELDRVIALALSGAEAEYAPDGELRGYHRGGSWVSIGPIDPVTSSVDAALALMEKHFSGGLGWWIELETAGMGAVIHGPEGEEFRGGGVGKDLPNAICIAVLRALEAQP